MRSIRWAWIPIAIAGACQTNPPGHSHPESVSRLGAPADAEDAFRSILAAVSNRYGDEWTDGESLELIVVCRATAPILDSHEALGASTLWKGLSKELPSLKRDTFDDFWSRKDESRVPLSFTDAGVAKVDYIGGAGPHPPWLGGVDQERWWRLRTWHPDSYLIFLSHAGWSADRRQGLVYIVFSGWCGIYFVVEKSGDDWGLTEEFVAWIT